MLDRFERFSCSIAEISRFWHRIADEEMGEYNLKGTYSVYFTTLYRFPQGLTAAQLVELCGRDKADVSRAMAVLVDKGLVARSGETGKAYRVPMVLTEQGRELAAHINRKAVEAVEQASYGLEEEKRLIFYEALDLITTNLQKLSQTGLTVPSGRK